MKTLKSTNLTLSLIIGLGLSMIGFQSIAQEYDDMYFTKSDRKSVKAEVKKASAAEIAAPSYKEAIATTESVSSKNINPEYVARYKETESSNQSAYSGQDYFIENYDKDSAITNQIDYAALNKREQMSQSNQYRNFSYPSWGFSPYMSMGYGMGFGMPFGYGYDPFMMGYGPSYSLGFGFGSGFYPSSFISMSMMWGSGYNPWGGWGAYPYRPYGMYGYDPFAYGYPMSYYGSGFCYPYQYGMNSYYGVGRPIYYINSSEANLNYKPRTNRSYADSKISRSSVTPDNSRITTASQRIRVPESTVNSTSSNGRIVPKDYSRSQNEYYNEARRNASSTSRISTSESTRSSYLRNTSPASGSSSLNQNRPSRSSGFSSYSNQSTSGSRSSSSSYSPSGSRSTSSYATPSRSSSSGYSNSSFSSGGNSSRSSSSYSSGSSSSGSRSFSSGSSSGSSSGRGGRQ